MKDFHHVEKKKGQVRSEREREGRVLLMQKSAVNTVHASGQQVRGYAITVVTFLAVQNADIRKITR